MSTSTPIQTLSYQDRLDITEFYESKMDRILDTDCFGFDKYRFPFLDRLNPIERMAFDECVGCGLVMYPEFPVDKFWCDLANPRRMWAIELDGNTHTKGSDDARDARLKQLGWLVFHVKAKDCFNTRTAPFESEDKREWYDFITEGGLNGLIWGLRRLESFARQDWHDIDDFEDVIDAVSVSTLLLHFSAE